MPSSPVLNPGLPIGFDEKGRQLFYRGVSHLLQVAPPRSGKARDILIPILLYLGLLCRLWKVGDAAIRSLLVIDPKGQLLSVCGPHLARAGYQLQILNPFKILPSVLAPGTRHFKGLDDRVNFFAKFNPMLALDPQSASFHADLRNLGDACFDGHSRQGWGETHWIEGGQDLFSGAVGSLIVNEADETLRNLPAVRRVLKSPRLLRRCAYFAQMEHGGQDESIASALEAFAKKDAENKNELASLRSTAGVQTQFLNVRAVAECLKGSDFKWPIMRRRPTAVFVVLPVKYLRSCARFFRLMFADCLNALLGDEKGLPVLCIADEFAQLGKLDLISDILALGAGLNIQLMPVLQDLNQLKNLYREGWESFPASAGVQMYFAARDYTTSEEISKLCGDTTVEVPSESAGSSKDVFGIRTGSQEGTAINRTQRRARLPQEIRQMPDNRFILFTDTMPGRFIEAYRRPYWEIDTYRGLYSPDPYHSSSAGGDEDAV